MPSVYKLMANNEVTLGSANTVNSGTLVRVCNASDNVRTITVNDPVANVVVGVITIDKRSELCIQKKPTDTLAADTGTDLKATYIAFTN